MVVGPCQNDVIGPDTVISGQIVVCKLVVSYFVVTTILHVDMVELAASSLLEGVAVGEVKFRYGNLSCVPTGALGSTSRHI